MLAFDTCSWKGCVFFEAFPPWRQSYTVQLTHEIAAMIAALVVSGCSSADDGVGGSGSIAGDIDGRAFDKVAASYLIGQPDDPDRTLVIYVFDAPIACSEIADTGWDEGVADATQSLEMKLVGNTPASYPIPEDGTPATGEADVNYTLTSTSGTPSEISATSGSVTLDSYTADTSAKGASISRSPEARSAAPSTPAFAPTGTTMKHRTRLLSLGALASMVACACSSTNSETNPPSDPCPRAGTVLADMRDVERDAEGISYAAFGPAPDHVPDFQRAAGVLSLLHQVWDRSREAAPICPPTASASSMQRCPRSTAPSRRRINEPPPTPVTTSTCRWHRCSTTTTPTRRSRWCAWTHTFSASASTPGTVTGRPSTTA